MSILKKLFIFSLVITLPISIYYIIWLTGTLEMYYKFDKLKKNKEKLEESNSKNIKLNSKLHNLTKGYEKYTIYDTKNKKYLSVSNIEKKLLKTSDYEEEQDFDYSYKEIVASDTPYVFYINFQTPELKNLQSINISTSEIPEKVFGDIISKNIVASDNINNGLISLFRFALIKITNDKDTYMLSSKMGELENINGVYKININRSGDFPPLQIKLTEVK